MKAYCLIRTSMKIQSITDFAEKISKIDGVLKADTVFGPWTVVAKIEGKTKEDISRARNEILKCGNVRQVVTLISIPGKDKRIKR